MDVLFEEVEAQEGASIAIDLSTQTVTSPSKQVFHFEVDDFRKHCLLNGLDDISLTLQQADAIQAYEEKRQQEAPWLF